MYTFGTYGIITVVTEKPKQVHFFYFQDCPLGSGFTLNQGLYVHDILFVKVYISL